MKITFVAPVLPPQINGVGDYTALLARELANDHQVRIWTGHNTPFEPIPGVEIEPLYRVGEPRSFRALETGARQQKPDWIVVQHSQFAWGKRGYNPELPRTLGRIRKGEKSRIALMAHEPFARPINFKLAVMGSWQKRQFHLMGRAAQAIFYSIEAWKLELERGFPHCLNQHLPVFSNLPRHPSGRQSARRALELAPGDFVLGLFGTVHETRLFARFIDAARAVQKAGLRPVVLYIGPHGSRVRAAMPGVGFLDQGALPAAEISPHFAAMDIYLAAFSDGISTRRGSLMAALQHGVPVVGTSGHLTDSLWAREEGRSLALAPVESSEVFEAKVAALIADEAQRWALGNAGRALYDREFSVEVAARRMMKALDSVA